MGSELDRQPDWLKTLILFTVIIDAIKFMILLAKLAVLMAVNLALK